jgi:hypothetical protein
MKWFSAGLTFVNVATITGLLLGILGSGLDEGFAGLALILATAAAIWAWFGASPYAARQKVAVPPPAPLPRSKRAQRRLLRENPEASQSQTAPPLRRWHFWSWAVGIVFLMFAVRSYCWLLWIDGNNLKIQSPNNLGDLALHLTYIKYFANGVALWPDNPIHAFSRLRYPAGIDFFNSLLILQHFDLLRVLVWTGLLGSVATFYALYRWGGAFTVAGFLFNGGIAGYAFFRTHEFIDYQGEKIAWKSIPLTMFVTQRGLLYAIPAGLLLLQHWRRKYYPGPGDESLPGRRGLIPWWVEWSIYATMPLFHVHTFLALSAVLAFWLIIGSWEMRKQIAILLAAALVPATWIVWMITDHFQAGSILAWNPGWVQSDPAFSNPALFASKLRFWWENFGLLLPAMVGLVGLVCWRFRKKIVENNAWKSGLAVLLSALATLLIYGLFVFMADDPASLQRMPLWLKLLFLVPLAVFAGLTIMAFQPVRSFVFDSLAFVLPAAGIFLFAIFVKTAPWGWDNTKLIIWAYFISLPFLWRDLIKQWPMVVRAGACFLLFISGFVCLVGGMKVGTPGFDIADRTELNAIADVLRQVPIKERFAAFPTYNHPLLLNGRKLVLGYPGHLWTQGFSEYGVIEQQLRVLMLGSPDWRQQARALHARYLFWGKQEEQNYRGSAQPWKGQAAVVAKGLWGTIYDLERPALPGQ